MGISSAIRAVECELGSESLTFEELEQRFGAEAMRKVLSGSGIRTRRVAPRGVTGADLAVAAADRLFENTGVDRASIDFLVHCTQSGDYMLPTTACLLQDRLRLPKTCGAFDINLGCSQYVYALSVAHSLIVAGTATRVLVTTGDTMSHTLHPMDRALVPLLGDAGSATLLEAVPEGEGFEGFVFGTDGSGAKHLMVPAGGFRRPSTPETKLEQTDAEGNIRTPENLYMNGTAIFSFAITMAPKIAQALMAKTGRTMEDLDLVVLHQASRYMVDYLVKKMKVPAEKTFFYVEDIGNTSGSTMPVLLHEAVRNGRLKPGMRVMSIVFGVGLSWAGTIIRWAEPARVEGL